ncbi:arf-GAP with coiled-coil, ANK repeat and PH domain-containing protein 2 [Daktulosphaira vitifoliae]|uniref:arf-GAP with coiled-coil, ANK repeat and PH domain-containing protein 2 n=1 Tax=Daktulosphaira vitifoliae TaxID=58002 RepID=UPI0021A9B1DB|nr:arf-GAP with coiled-coil, ANK repeat and PH domain-containing protein 2 [Daktulosphaira vitifoliae]
MQTISVSDCLQDSPKFRNQLERHESNIDLLEHRLEKVVKVCSLMIDSGKTYVSQQSLFANSLWEMGLCFRDDTSSTKNLNKIIHALQEMNKFLTTFLDQASRTVLNNLTVFVKEDIKASKESKHTFEKAASELDGALLRNSQILKSRPNEADELMSQVASARIAFRHAALDHVHCITMLLARKKPEIFSTLLSYIQAWSTYFHHGYTLTEDLQDFIQNLNEEVEVMIIEAGKMEKQLGEHHKLVNSNDTVMINGDDNEINAKDKEVSRIEGYLYKRTSNAFKTWNRRWFYLKNNQLAYRKRSGEDLFTVMEEDLRLCSVKPAYDAERRFCFEVLSPTKSHILQADSEHAYKSWIEALQQGIGAAIQQSGQRNTSPLGGNNQFLNDFNSLNNRLSNSSKLKKSKTLEVLIKIAGNEKCCDCKAPNPSWASINLAITLCIECSGVHRSLGVHYSKVRSLTLDDWEPEILKVLAEVGNAVVNDVYEYNVPSNVVRASAKCQDSVREQWIRKKYVDRLYVKPLPNNQLKIDDPDTKKWSVRKVRRRGIQYKSIRKSNLKKEADDNVMIIGGNAGSISLDAISSDDDSTISDDGVDVGEEDISTLEPDMLLYKAATAHNLPVMCHAIAMGANKNWRNPNDKGRTCLFQAIYSGSVMACEYLILNAADINIQDDDGETPLFYATQLGHTAQVCLLLKHKADQYLKNQKGVEPLQVAIHQANADIVTLLKLGRLNEEIKNSEHGNAEESFNDVVRDFTQQLTFSPSHK